MIYENLTKTAMFVTYETEEYNPQDMQHRNVIFTSLVKPGAAIDVLQVICVIPVYQSDTI